MYHTRKKRILMAPLSLILDPEERQQIENFADKERISLNKAARTLINFGIDQAKAEWERYEK